MVGLTQAEPVGTVTMAPSPPGQHITVYTSVICIN